MFGHDSKPSRIFSYGARPPSGNAALVAGQMRRAHVYRNDLVRMELDRRAASETVLRRHFPDVVQAEEEAIRLQAALDEVRGKIKVCKVRENAPEATPEQKAAARAERRRLEAEAREMRPGVTAAWQRFRALRKAAWTDPALQADLETVEAGATARRKQLRALLSEPIIIEHEGGDDEHLPPLFWGSYLPVEQSAGSFRIGAPPRFRPWRGDGKIAVQLQKGLDVAGALLGTDNRLRLVPQGGNPKYWTAWLRAGTEDNGRSPVWVTVPFVHHRPLPDGCRIKWAYLVRRRIATHDRWQLQFVIEKADGFDPGDRAAGGIVAVDVGWRRLFDQDTGRPAGLRVAYWCGVDADDKPHEGELVISEADLSRWAHVESLQAIRDRAFNAVRARLGEWLRTTDAAIPDWLRERARSMHAWRSPKHLVRLVLHWRAHRFAGDEAIFATLDPSRAWREQDRHLWDWCEAERGKAIRWRDDLYRNFAADMRRRFGRVAFEKLDWRKLQKRAVAEEPEDGALRERMRVAAVGRLLDVLREGFAEEAHVPIDPSHTTADCWWCGARQEFDRALREHRCTECRTLWDQDRSASLNLLTRAGVNVCCIFSRERRGS